MEPVHLGIDLGTSSVKVVALDSRGDELASDQLHYPISRPQPQWAEQDPHEWWQATSAAVKRLLAGAGGAWHVESVGLSGQMHGVALVDARGVPIRPAITWSDSRSGEQVARWARIMDPKRVERIAGMPMAAGMMAASLAWLKDHEPGVLAQARQALLPKDYLRFRLTGRFGTEPTDAAGSLLYDLRGGYVSAEITAALGIDPALFPVLGRTMQVAGRITSSAAVDTGLPEGVPVAFGGSDQAMAALALGIEDESLAAVALSSGGTAVKRTRSPLDAGHGLHVMPFVEPGTWFAMGVVLAAGLAIDWLNDDVFGEGREPAAISKLMAAAAGAPPGADGLIALPHLGGIRTPRADDTARGHLIGLGYNHGRPQLARAMIEGIAFSLLNSLSLMSAAGEPAREITLSGGAARFGVWREVISGVSGLPVRISSDLLHSAIGAAMAGAAAVGSPLPERGGRLEARIIPDPALVDRYASLAERFWHYDRLLDDTKRPTQPTLSNQEKTR